MIKAERMKKKMGLGRGELITIETITVLLHNMNIKQIQCVEFVIKIKMIFMQDTISF